MNFNEHITAGDTFSSTQTSPVGPYGVAAMELFRLAWSPIPVVGKSGPKKGFTGEKGARPDFEQVQAWVNGPEASRNVGVRLPDHVIGLDVDAYGDRVGKATKDACVERWGSLPATWHTTPRGDGESGIYLFRVPVGLDFSGAEDAIRAFGENVDIIRSGHRYAMVAPSIHPDTKRPYCWYTPDGSISPTPPRLGDLAELPDAWVAGLTAGQPQNGRASWTTPPTIDSEHVGVIPAGIRDKRLVAYAGHLHAAGVPYADAKRAFSSRWHDCEQPPGNVLTWDTAVATCLNYAYRNGEASPATVVASLTSTPFTQIQRERLTWIWPRFIAAGKLHVIEGDPGTGKSSITLEIAATLSKPGTWPDGAVNLHAADTLICTVEDGAGDTVRPRLEYAGADLNRIHFVHNGEMDPLFSIPGDLEKLRERIVKTGAKLVIIDPLNAYLSEKADAYSDQKVRTALTPLATLAAQTGAAIVVVRHLRKGDGSALYRGAGSIGIAGAARFVYLIGLHPENGEQRVFASSKRNIGAAPSSLAFQFEPVTGDEDFARIKWLGAIGYSADDVASDDQGEADPIESWLRTLLTAGKEMPSADVRAAALKVKFAWRTVHRVAKRIGVHMRRTDEFQSSTFWSLPPPSVVPVVPVVPVVQGLALVAPLEFFGTTDGADGPQLRQSDHSAEPQSRHEKATRDSRAGDGVAGATGASGAPEPASTDLPPLIKDEDAAELNYHCDECGEQKTLRHWPELDATRCPAHMPKATEGGAGEPDL